MASKNILVFPCGSEIGLEIHRSLRYSSHVNLFGANSVDDHGRFVYDNYIGDVPDVHEPGFVDHLKKVIQDLSIDVVYPTMDEVIVKTKAHERELKCMVIASPVETTEICLSKRRTYARLRSVTKVPALYPSPDDVQSYPVFTKPDTGYGSRGASMASHRGELDVLVAKNPQLVIMEYLPGSELTIDCFTNYQGRLLFAGPRPRRRTMNGISVSSGTIPTGDGAIARIADQINRALPFQGAWFFQLKADASGEWVLLEIASRLGGTSSVHRMQGVNFALLSIFDAFGQEVEIRPNAMGIEVDRALDSRYKVNIQFKTAYIDLDDTLIIRDKANITLISLVFQFINDQKNIVLMTKHDRGVQETLRKHRLNSLFDKIIVLSKSDQKADFIRDANSIFIDDSFTERKAVMDRHHIPVFAPDAVDCLFH